MCLRVAVYSTCVCLCLGKEENDIHCEEKSCMSWRKTERKKRYSSEEVSGVSFASRVCPTITPCHCLLTRLPIVSALSGR